jgi:hypothetical protein
MKIMFFTATVALTVVTMFMLESVYAKAGDFVKDMHKQNVQKFLELGEEGFRTYCLSDHYIRELTKDIPGLAEKFCEGEISNIKSETGRVLQENSSDSIIQNTTS